MNQSQSIVSIDELRDLHNSAQALVKTKHYKKLGYEGIFAVLQMAKSLNIDPYIALNGGLYYINGRIEMDGQTMMSLIRQAGHSITRDKRSTDTLCILHGKRADNGDTWTESFGIEDAKKAGLLTRGGGMYAKYGSDMFKWRALSRLARFLFPDCIRRCYIAGELSLAPPINSQVDDVEQEECANEIQCELNDSRISEEMRKDLESLLCDDKYKVNVMKYLKDQYKIESLEDLSYDLYDRLKKSATKYNESKQKQTNSQAKEAQKTA